MYAPSPLQQGRRRSGKEGRMEKVDVIVVGGGLAGLSAAYGLAAEGLRSSSSSGATTRGQNVTEGASA